MTAIRLQLLAMPCVHVMQTVIFEPHCQTSGRLSAGANWLLKASLNGTQIYTVTRVHLIIVQTLYTLCVLDS